MSAKHRLLFITSNSEWGGSEVLWSQAALRFARAGNDVHAAAPRAPGFEPLFTQLREAGASTHAYDVARITLASKVRHRLQGDAHAALLRAIAPDLVVISQGLSYDGLRWAELCADAKIPFVTIAQAVREQSWPSDDEADRIIAAFGRAKQNYFVSHGNLRLFRMQLGHALQPAAVIYNARGIPSALDLRWPSSEPFARVACVGRLDPRDKGQDLVLETLARPRWQPRPLQAHFFGTGRSQRGLARLTNMLGLEHKAFFHGPLAIESIWAEHHALLLPSRSEGFSLAVMEAMLCARLVITTAVADNAQVIEDGKTGFLIAAPTVDALDDALERAWAARAHWQELGLRAQEHIRHLLPADPAASLCESLSSHLDN